MILTILAVKNLSVQAFQSPMFVRHQMQAHRWFSDECNNPQSEFAKHPEDYELHLIGTWDDESGQFDTTEPVLVLRGVQCKQ